MGSIKIDLTKDSYLMISRGINNLYSYYKYASYLKDYKLVKQSYNIYALIEYAKGCGLSKRAEKIILENTPIKDL